MFRKHKIILLAFMFGLIFLSINVIPTHAQSDDFPLGLNITYVVGVDFPPSHYEYQSTYDFIRWIDQENLIVEFEINGTTDVAPFHEIHLPGPAHPPLWMNVSTWSVGNTIEISGVYYPIIMMEDIFLGPPGTHECFRLERVFQADGRENASSFWYHAELGLLVDYLRVDMDIASNEMIEAHTAFVIDGNVDQFDPPTFTKPEPTQTTTTTTPTTTSTTTSTTMLSEQTSPTSTAGITTFSGASLTFTLGIGIIFEILIIIEMVRKRK